MTVYPAQVHGQTLLVLLVRTNAKFREEFAWFVGTAKYDQGKMWVDRHSSIPLVELPQEALTHLNVSDESMKKAFAPSDYLITIRIDTQTEPELTKHFDLPGLTWED